MHNIADGKYQRVENIWICANKAWNIHGLITVRHLQHSFQCFSLHFFTFLEIMLSISEEKLEHCSSEELIVTFRDSR